MEREKRDFGGRSLGPPFALLLVKPDRLIELAEPLLVPLIRDPHQIIQLF